MSFLTHLYGNVAKYQALLLDCMSGNAESAPPFTQLSSLSDPARLVSNVEILEQRDGRLLTLIQQRTSHSTPPEELVLRVQGFLVESTLPPIRHNQLPSNPNRLIDLRQTVTVSGLGMEPFDGAVSAVMTIYQHFCAHLVGHNLRTWSTSRLENHLTLSFGNRYLTASKFAEGEPRGDLSDVVDPFYILEPHLTTQVHLQENVVEYWEQTVTENQGSSFRRIKPDVIFPGTMVELQIAFAAVKVGRHEYIFLPKLRAICVLSRAVQSDYNSSAIKELSLRAVSPLKKVKCKVGYGEQEETGMEESRRQLKRMSLHDSSPSHVDESTCT
ncbi:hypothetical protein VTO73DRAFT_11052 [Trametes versicolor]